MKNYFLRCLELIEIEIKNILP